MIDPVEWPEEVEIYGAEESDVKKKAVKEIFEIGMKKDDKHLHQILKAVEDDKTVSIRI